jgi:asparagine synthase (glutamine-hydrolysing)
MCGLAGIAGQSNKDAIQEMTRQLAHRGPDGEGFYFTEGVALGHRRLSVIDLETGHQPMTTPDGRHTIVFNGEIYNFPELRKELESRGTRFRTRSDTEVLLEAYAAWGNDAVRKLRGMFAFAVWDAANRQLFAARDRLGLKPLYFAEVRGSLIFASEMKGLLAHPEIPREIDLLALDDFLTYLYVPAPRTIFRRIQELPPGHWLEWQDDHLRVSRYWDLTFTPKIQPPQDHLEEVQALLAEAVRVHLASDVPLGVFLSGGLDSSVVTALMARSQSAQVSAFTLGFRDGEHRYSEWEYARTVAEAVGAHTRELIVPAESAALLSSVTRHFDEPFGNPTSLLIYQLSQLARQYVTVAMVGDGGDEVFLGYPRYRGVMFAEQYRRVPRVLRNIASGIAQYLPEPGNGNHFPRRLREFTEGSHHLPERMYFQWISYFSSGLRRRLYSPALTHELSDYDSSEFLMALFRRCGPVDGIDRVNYVDLHSFLPFNILRYADRMSMAHGLELRAPFIDHRLIEKMASVPWRYKLRGNQTKVILRKAAEKLLPPKILARGKLGLNPPMGLWLRGRLKHLLEEYLSPHQVRQRGYFRPEVVQELIHDHHSGRRDYSLHLWALISFEEWHRQYLDVKPNPLSTIARTEIHDRSLGHQL